MDRFGSDNIGRTSFPGNRWEALKEAERLLSFKPFEWERFDKILRRIRGLMIFSQGDVEIVWERFDKDEARAGALQLILNIKMGHSEASATYEFDLKELAQLKRTVTYSETSS